MEIGVRLMLLWVFLTVTAGILDRINAKQKADKNQEKVERIVEETEKVREPYVRKKKKEEEQPKDQPMERYMRAVIWLSRYLAESTRMVDMMKRGEHVERRRLLYALSMARQYRELLPELKKTLGLDADLSAFSVEQRFAGFELKEGRIIRDKKADINCVEEVTRKWIKGFPERYDAFHFEVAQYLRALDEPLTDEYYPEEWQKEWQSARRCKAA